MVVYHESLRRLHVARSTQRAVALSGTGESMSAQVKNAAIVGVVKSFCVTLPFVQLVSTW